MIVLVTALHVVLEHTFRMTYSVPETLSSVPAYFEYTTFSPS